MLIVGRQAAATLLADREEELIGLVREAYRLHDEGFTALPHSVFLRFPDDARNRIIGLPAYLGGPDPVAGMKWISSFPRNVVAGMERASAAIILNSTATGRPEALVEGSVISAKRTAASAALAAGMLAGADAESVALIGCGVINFEVLRFLAAALPRLRAATLYDLDPRRAEAFKARAAEALPRLQLDVAAEAKQALGGHRLIALATVAARPHMGLEDVRPGSTVLHISLRDLHPASILGSVNVVDDADHVCREGTSLHLAEQQIHDRSFISASIGQLIRGTARLSRRPGDVVVFSPFGLGVLDLALARLVRDEARARGLGATVDFLP
jgi:ornithine cyclodeaminase